MKWNDERISAPTHIWTIGNTRLEYPDIPKPEATIYQHTLEKNPAVFPHAHFISIFKVRDDKKKYRVHSRIVVSRVYGIGVLTDEGNYYYSELVTRIPVVTQRIVSMFSTMLTFPYRIDENTLVVLSKNIHQPTDPVNLMFSVMRQVNPMTVSYRELHRMLRVINSYFHIVKPVRGHKVSCIHKNEIVQNLIDKNRFAFIDDPDWIDKMSIMTETRAAAYLNTALGIVYLFSRWKRSKSYYRLKKLRKKGEIKKTP